MVNSNKVVVIIGSSSGIGRATAMLLANHGFNLVLASRHQEEISNLAQLCQKKGVKVLAVKVDISREEDVESLVRQAVDTFGSIDVWINDAAVTAYGDFEEVPIHCVQQIINTNIMGCIYGSRAAIRHFKSRKKGTLINASSIAGLLGQPYSSYYALSKFAVRGLCMTLQAELAPFKGIHVCCVMPASMDTPFFQHAANFSGRALKSLSPTFDPYRVARTVLKLIDRPKPEVFVGINPWPMVLLRLFFPEFFARKYLKYTIKNHFKNAPAPPTEGNLFAPMKAWSGNITGGWKGRRF
jgi:short-subunit dehydrogenase